MASQAKCVSCGQEGRSLKVISCLHALCVDCVEACLDSQNSIQCVVCQNVTASSGQGGNQWLSLPNNYPRAHSAMKHPRRTYSAMTVLMTIVLWPLVKIVELINVMLMEGHILFLVAPKITNCCTSPRMANKREATASSSDEALEIFMCPVHHSKPLTQYCWQCHEELCERCISRSNHTNHSDMLMDIPSAASKARDMLKATHEESKRQWRWCLT